MPFQTGRKTGNMAKNVRKFLWISLICILVLCIGVFVWITAYMIDENDRTISDVGEIYMSEMGKQISMHFATVMELYQSKLRGVTGSNPQEEADGADTAAEELAASAAVFGFNYLGLYSGNGSYEDVLGGEIVVDGEEAFTAALKSGEAKITDAKNKDGETLLLIGMPAAYPMGNGEISTLLIAGVPMETVNETLSLEIGATQVYSHIIRHDGTYVIRNADAAESSYFDRIVDYGNFDGQSPEEVVGKISEAMAAGAEYSMVIEINGEIRNTHFIPLKDSDWYLVSVLPYGLLQGPTTRLLYQRIYVAIGGCMVIVLAMLLAYIRYFRMSRQQMRLLEIAKKEAESASRAKSAFLSSMSHDIRTPMNAIMGMTAIAAANLDNPAKLQDCLKKITLSSKHLLGLINDVLDKSKIDSGKLSLNMDLLSLRETMDSITNIVQPQIKAKKQNFDIFIGTIQTEHVYCDGVRLNQIFLNLLSNAVKFTPEGGTIEVRLAQENSPKGACYVRNDIRVMDTGIGMSPEFQKSIFNSFTREDTSRVRKTEGTGLGMAITKYIIDEMGGSIELRSEVDRGTEFHIILDLERGADQEKDMFLPDWELLVVDDDELLCRTAVAALGEIGVDADCAFDGKTAVEMTIRRHRERRDYQIVLLDWKMPGMDGIETAKEIRKCVGKEIPILLISAYDWSEIEEEARAAGINGFISKPLFKSTLFYGLAPFSEYYRAEYEQDREEADDYTGRRILLAEDNEINWEIVNTLLSAHGFVIEWTKNGNECVERYEASPPGYYDAVLMDVRMPVMDGYEAAKQIRESGRTDCGIPIIAMTADAFTEDIRRCLESGMDAHIAKPIDIRELLKILKKHLRKK